MAFEESSVMFILLFLGTIPADQQHCRTLQSISNRALNGHVIEASWSSSVERCQAKCEKNPDCYSTNYMLASKSCELNKGTRLSHPDKFLPRENTVYFDNLFRQYHACVHPPCQNGATCVILAQSPGYECKCQPKYGGYNCQECNGEELGMSNNRIRNSAITASTYEPDSPPSSARIYSPGGWRALSNDSSPYLEITFGSAKLITAVATQGWVHPNDSSLNCWVVEYYLDYSGDGTTWRTHKEDLNRRVFQGNKDADSYVKNRISKPFHCIALRVRPIKWKVRPAMRAEVYGCEAYG